MDSHPTVLRETDTIGKGVQLIMEHRYRNVPVVDEEGRYLGVFGVSSLLRLVLPKAATLERGLTSIPFVTDTLKDLRLRLREVEDQPVTFCMTEDVVVVTPDTELVETLLVLYRTRTSLPVVEKRTGRLVGMISYFDVGKKVLAQDL